jgi:hypothetical protein
MNNMNFGDPFLQYGPGLASLWGGEQVGLNFDSQRINQQKGLEDILTSQQTRQQSAEMQPFKVDEARIKNQKAKDEITAANLQQFTDAVYQDVLAQGNIQGPPDSVGNAARWSGQAKAMGLDPEDYRVKVILGTAAQGPQGLAKVREALYRMSSKGLEKTDDANRQKAMDIAAGQRNDADNTTQRGIAAGNNATQIRVAEIRKEQELAKAQAKAAQASQLEKARNFEAAAVAYATAAASAADAGNQELANTLQQRANSMLEQHRADLQMKAQAAQQGNPQFNANTGQLQPRAAPPNPALNVPGVGGTQAPNPAPQAQQLSPTDQQALQWARSNPQDPRSRAILQKLGVQ